MNSADLAFLRSRLSNHYGFEKPNDVRALNLMNLAATHVVTSIPEIVLAYGISDEYSFVFHKSTNLFERRNAKLVSTVVSTFTAAYVALWPTAFQSGSAWEDGTARASLDVTMLPTFDGRVVCYPSWENLRDYLSWRQVDCTFFFLVALPYPFLKRDLSSVFAFPSLPCPFSFRRAIS
jgi:tRNA(His) guanylyltransferase